MFFRFKGSRVTILCVLAFVFGLLLSFILRPFLIIVIEGVVIFLLCALFFCSGRY